MGWLASVSKEKTEIIKNLFDIFMKFVLVTLIIFCIAWKGFIETASDYTGIDIFAAAGGKIQKYSKNADQKVVELTSRIDDLNVDLKQAKLLIEKLTPTAPATVALDASRLQTSLAESVTKNDIVLRSAAEFTRQAPIATTQHQTGSWGVLAGSDRSFIDTGTESDALKKLGFTPRIFLRLGWYRTVAQFESRDAAALALPLIPQRRNDAYIIELEKWCVNRTSTEAYITCGR